MTARESVQAKAVRLLAGGRVTVLSLDGDNLTAVCVGDTGAYDCGHEPGRGWFCDCPVFVTGRRDTCAHLTALRLITIRRGTS